MKSSLFSVVIILTATVGFAGTYMTDTIEYSAGSGDNSATIVVDFDFDNYFVFTYSWDGTATGWDAINALDQFSDLCVTSQDYGAWGMYVQDLMYPAGQKYDYVDDGSLGWAYYQSEDNLTWAADSSVSFRTLMDGDWDAWVWTNHDMDNLWTPVRQPGEAPVPEPASMMLLSLGGLWLSRKR